MPVCRVPKSKLLRRSEEELGITDMSDEEMFEAADTENTGAITLQQFAAYMNAHVDEDIGDKFNQYVCI